MLYILEHYEAIAYEHRPELAPTAKILDDYRSDHDWERYRRRFNYLLRQREWEDALTASLAGGRRVVLLCSEALPERCHRTLVANAYRRRHSSTDVLHLVVDPPALAAAEAEAISSP